MKLPDFFFGKKSRLQVPDRHLLEQFKKDVAGICARHGMASKEQAKRL